MKREQAESALFSPEKTIQTDSDRDRDRETDKQRDRQIDRQRDRDSQRETRHGTDRDRQVKKRSFL